MPQHSVIENFQLAFVSIQYFFRQRLWQSPTESFHYTAHDPKTFFKRMKILIYYLFLEFVIANEKQTHMSTKSQFLLTLQWILLQDYGLRPRHYLIYFSVVNFFPFLWITVCQSLFQYEQTFHTGIIFLIILHRKDFHAYFY